MVELHELRLDVLAHVGNLNGARRLSPERLEHNLQPEACLAMSGMGEFGWRRPNGRRLIVAILMVVFGGPERRRDASYTSIANV